jgi:PAS domain S-box-containing protein
MSLAVCPFILTQPPCQVANSVPANANHSACVAAYIRAHGRTQRKAAHASCGQSVLQPVAAVHAETELRRARQGRQIRFKVHAQMSTGLSPDRKWNQRPNEETRLGTEETTFRAFFERSADAISVLDPAAGVFVDCNQAAVELMRCQSREQLLQLRPQDIAPEYQPDGRLSAERAAEIVEFVSKNGSLRFEWLARRLDGTELLIEVLATAVPVRGRLLHVCVSHDLTERKRTGEELERRIAERTAELSASEERLRTLVEHAPEAIVVLDGATGQFVACNENAARLYGYSQEELLQFRPEDVSPLTQPDGRLSIDVAREKIAEALAGRTPVFDWMHRHSSGRLLPCEVRLVSLPGDGRKLVRGSVINNTDRNRREKVQRTIYEISEAVHAAQDLEGLYRRLHEIIRVLMPAQNFYLALHDAISDQHYYAYHVDEVDPRPAPRKMVGGLNGYVLTTGKALLANRASMTDPRNEWRLRSGTPSAIWLGVPLSIRGRTIGVMAVQDYHDETAYGEEEKQILTFVAEQIASAIERKRREEIQRATYQITEAVQRAEDLDSLYTRIHEIVKGLMAAENFYIALLDPATASISFPYYVDEANPVAPLPRQIGTGLTGYVLRTQKPALVSRTANRPKARLGEGLLLEGLELPYIESGSPAAIWLGVPLTVRGQAIGVMAVQDYHDERAYGEEEKQILTFVAAQVAAAIDRKRAEQALRESEEKFRALFETSGQGVMLHDEEKFIEVNPATVRLLGFNSADEIIGHHPVEFAAPIQPGGLPPEILARRYIEQCMTTGTARFDWICRNPQGREIPLEVILTRIQWSGRQIIQAVINDITHRKRAEAELLKALAREKELGQLKSNFVSMVSHEFRTPLGVIMSSAEILQDYLDKLDASERSQHLFSIRKNTRRMADLMEEVLLIGRLDAGKMDFQPKEIDLRALCERVADAVSSATNQICPVALQFHGDLDGLKADERLLEHVFTNLLSNAVKYSEPGRPVDFIIERQSHNVVCTVRDRGIGIPDADQAWMFNPFHRGQNVGQRPGTGLGLSIVKRCMELHGGNLSIQSKLGEGTTVTVTFLGFLSS